MLFRSMVEVFSFNGEFLGIGHYQIGSITVRILSFDRLGIDTSFWYNKLLDAYNSRKSINLINNPCTNAYRLVHGEGDSLPGLIIDIYKDVAVIQAHSAGMYLSLPHINDSLRQLYGDQLVAGYNKSATTAPFKAGLDLKDGYLWRKDDNILGETIIIENNNKFLVNWETGQKTGFFLDQRDNRELVKKYSHNKRVLNLFCYTGGFSIYALSNYAAHVDSVDSSKTAIELVNKNIEINGFTNHTSYCEDAIEFMRNSSPNKYDLIIVDPPAFAKHRGSLDNALRAYRRLNALAIEKVNKGGIIFTYSCSQVVDKHSFSLAIFSAEIGRASCRERVLRLV